MAAVVALIASIWSYRTHPRVYEGTRSDFAIVHAAATALQQGHDPYPLIGPGRAYDIPFPMVYPLTAVIVGVPFTWVTASDALFVAAGAGLFVWGVTRRWRYRWALAGLSTPAFILTMQMSQWTSLLVGAALVPSCGFLLVCKPTIGAALFAAFPSRQAIFGGIALVILSLVLLPAWPGEWLQALPAATQTRAPLTFWGGPLLLLGLLRWREPEARLLVAMSAVPHTPELYESLPLFLIPNSAAQATMLAALNWGVVIARGPTPPGVDYVHAMALTGQWMVWLLYMPCLAMVLSRSTPLAAEQIDQTPGGVKRPSAASQPPSA